MPLKYPKLSLLLTFVAPAAIAQENKPVEELKEVVVTANKISQTIQEIPASISVINDIDMEDKGIQNITGVVKQIPNLSETNYGFQRAINFRGINPSQFSSTNPVVIYVDGVPQSSIFGYDVLLEDAERIEVLRGPQSTLYGKDSIGGVINVISKEPDNEWQGRVGLEYGSNNHLQGAFNASGALVEDAVFLNIGSLASKNDGWITNDYNNSDANPFKEGKFNTSLTVKPNEKMTAKLALGASKTKTEFLNAGLGEFGKLTRDNAKHANFDVPSPITNKSFSQALNLDYDFDTLKFSSLTTHNNIKLDSVFDGDNTYDPKNDRLMNGLSQFQDTEIDTFSQEFKFSNDKNETFKWVAGLYFEKEDSQFNRLGNQFPYTDPSSGNYFGPVEYNVPSQTDAKTQAIFAQGTYNFTNAVSLTLGGRYQHIEKDTDLTSYLYPVGTGKDSAVRKIPQLDNASWNAFLPKVSLRYAFNESSSVYASYAKGYLPGGFNYFPNPPGDNLKFEEQTSDNFEIGMRGNFLDGDLDLGASIFYMNIDDIHLYNFGIDANNSFFSSVSNGGEATSKGIEFDSTYRMGENWVLNSALGFTNAKYDKHTNETFNGNTVRSTPKYTANVGLGYFHPQGFYGRVDVNAQGAIYFDDANTQKQKAWTTADLKIGYLKDDLNIYGYVKNITDESYVENYLNKLIYFNEPRTFGIGMKYSF